MYKQIMPAIAVIYGKNKPYLFELFVGLCISLIFIESFLCGMTYKLIYMLQKVELIISKMQNLL